jgi:cytochrome c
MSARTPVAAPKERSMRLHLATAIAIGLATAVALAGFAAAAPALRRDTGQAAAVERGEKLARRNCTGCHAVGLRGASPNAAAPPLRALSHRYPADSLDEAFQSGLLTRHPAMPQFRFVTRELADLTAYLKSLRTRTQTEARLDGARPIAVAWR